MAGVGIEYCWGKAKYEFRGHINTKATDRTKLEANVMAALGKDEYTSRSGATRPAPLPRERVWRFARKARDYMRAYGSFVTPAAVKRAATEGGNTAFAVIEKLIKVFKFHRCTGDIQFRTCVDAMNTDE